MHRWAPAVVAAEPHVLCVHVQVDERVGLELIVVGRRSQRGDAEAAHTKVEAAAPSCSCDAEAPGACRACRAPSNLDPASVASQAVLPRDLETIRRSGVLLPSAPTKWLVARQLDEPRGRQDTQTGWRARG